MKPQHWQFSVAPMMDWTDKHCRFFHRLISRQALLYTEMVTVGALLYGDAPRFLAFQGQEHPVALQLGGSDPRDLALCAKMAQAAGYDEVNLNCGCPSDRVQKGAFGACLMAQPELVRDCVKAMLDAVDIPVTVKCRIGIDDMDEDRSLFHFVDIVSQSGVKGFCVHARKAWLKGLSPKQNRDVPPLNYDRIHALKEGRPELTISLNGGLKSIEHGLENRGRLDGIMLGRAVYQQPFDTLVYVDSVCFGHKDRFDSKGLFPRIQIALEMANYIDRQARIGVPPKSVVRHMMGLLNGLAGAKKWRRSLSENAACATNGDLVRQIIEEYVHESNYSKS